jgi:hypothetical protein
LVEDAAHQACQHALVPPTQTNWLFVDLTCCSVAVFLVSKAGEQLVELDLGNTMAAFVGTAGV